MREGEPIPYPGEFEGSCHYAILHWLRGTSSEHVNIAVVVIADTGEQASRVLSDWRRAEAFMGSTPGFLPDLARTWAERITTRDQLSEPMHYMSCVQVSEVRFCLGRNVAWHLQALWQSQFQE